MTAEIICVGTELLLGDIVNTNARFISRALSEVGISCYYQQVVGDNPDRLRSAAMLAKHRSDVVIYTGGLGPTDDDLTKQTIAQVYNDTLIFSQSVYDSIKEYFGKTGRVMTENNVKQAYVPSKGSYMHNNYGTAPGIIFTDEGNTAFLMPGVPREMRPMMTDSVMPILKSMCGGIIKSSYVRVIGIGESALEEKLYDILSQNNPTAALYAKEGEVTLRLTAKADSEASADMLIADTYTKVRGLIDEYIYGVDVDSIEQVIVNTLTEKHMTVSSAESCTGGNISAKITSVSGASSVFALGMCTYSDEQKHLQLGVSESSLKSYSAVSYQVAKEMVLGIRQKADSDYAVATTGYAGPGGGTDEDPVGTVYIAVCDREKEYVRKYRFVGDRQRVTALASKRALDMLRRIINNLPIE